MRETHKHTKSLSVIYFLCSFDYIYKRIYPAIPSSIELPYYHVQNSVKSFCESPHLVPFPKFGLQAMPDGAEPDLGELQASSHCLCQDHSASPSPSPRPADLEGTEGTTLIHTPSGLAPRVCWQRLPPLWSVVMLQ